MSTIQPSDDQPFDCVLQLLMRQSEIHDSNQERRCHAKRDHMSDPTIFGWPRLPMVVMRLVRAVIAYFVQT